MQQKLQDLITAGDAAQDAYTPIAAAVVSDQTALQTAQKQLADDQAAQATALATLQAAGHAIIAEVTVEYLIGS